MTHTTTDQLKNKLLSIKSTKELRALNTETESRYRTLSFSEYICGQLSSSGLSAAELIRESGLQRNYGYQILSGTRRPGRNKVIALALALRLPLDEVQRALAIAGEGALYPKNSRDSILIFAIGRQLSVSRTNELLFKSNKDTL